MSCFFYEQLLLAEGLLNDNAFGIEFTPTLQKPEGFRAKRQG
jgi:hypothetical protein